MTKNIEKAFIYKASELFGGGKKPSSLCKQKGGQLQPSSITRGCSRFNYSFKKGGNGYLVTPFLLEGGVIYACD